MELLIPILLIVALGIAANLFGFDSRDGKPNWPTKPTRAVTSRPESASDADRTKRVGPSSPGGFRPAA